MSDEVILKSFQFSIPIELLKSEKPEEDEAVDSWKIQGIASTQDEDLQGEVVTQDGLDISLLKAGRGLFNYDHQKGPENVIGQIDDGDFVKQDGKKALLVKGYLFKHQPRAQAFYNILKSVRKGGSSRVHLSIEGKILQRDFQNQHVIKKARIDKVALTLDPVNPNTYVDFLKSLGADTTNVVQPEITQENQQVVTFTVEEALKIEAALKKTMAAGAGYAGAPSAMQGGEPLTKESLDKDSKKVNAGKKKKKITKSEVELIIDSIRKVYPDCDPVEVADMVCKAVLRKLTKEC